MRIDGHQGRYIYKRDSYARLRGEAGEPHPAPSSFGMHVVWFTESGGPRVGSRKHFRNGTY